MGAGIDLVTTLLATQTVTRLVKSGEWESVKQRLRRDDQPGAVAQVDHAMASLDLGEVAALADLEVDEVASLASQTEDDVIYKVLDVARMEDRSIKSTVLGIRSAEKVGENLARATQGPDLRQLDLDRC